jgi:hypothetical protein
MLVKNPNGKERALPEVGNNIAAELMEEAKKAYDVAETYRDSDWIRYSTAFVRAAKIENAALEVERALN